MTGVSSGKDSSGSSGQETGLQKSVSPSRPGNQGNSPLPPPGNSMMRQYLKPEAPWASGDGLSNYPPLTSLGSRTGP